MEFDYEGRSRRLIEQLDWIQNYLQGLPPLPKVDNLFTKLQSRELDELKNIEQSLRDEDADSDETSGTGRSTKQQRTTQIDKSAGELLRQSPSFMDGSGSSIVVPPSQTLSLPEGKTKKTKKREGAKIVDPLRPTKRRSFGLDIGQGMNVINYIKQNCNPGSVNRNKRLANIITRNVSTSLHTEKSMETIYTRGPLMAESSAASMQLKTIIDPDIVRHKPSGRFIGGGTGPNFASISDSDVYRVRYRETVVELTHYHGLDTLQELFVPYMGHNASSEVDPPGRYSSDLD